MNDKERIEERIEELKKQIELLKCQIKAIKPETKLDWTKYFMFGNGEYCTGLCCCGVDGVTERVRLLAMRLMSLRENYNGYGDKYVTYEKCESVMRMQITKEQAKFVNGFIDEIYPIIEKYAMIALNDKENLKGNKSE